ncbi:transmembrane channel-like protein 7 isoform X2 [Dysidea avara]|uniref:transmembrane channel-like protein 7 isoform X2 n=1 Tax=Dysidea avara TaxID=196820 RepID=UPI00332C5CC2
MNADWTQEDAVELHVLQDDTLLADRPPSVDELPSQLAAELEDDTPISILSGGDASVQRFRHEVNTLSQRRRGGRNDGQRRSSRRQPLRERIQEDSDRSHRHSNISWVQTVRERKDLYWPRIHRQLTRLFGYRLWSGHLKNIEGEFGTGPVSYFVFVRFLLLANLLMFLVWFGFVCIPQISWRYGDGEDVIDDPSRSQLRCLRSCDLCPVGTATVYSCNLSTNGSVVINLCSDNNCGSSGRPRESSDVQRVCVNGSDDRYCVFGNVDPEVGGFQWIIDFITGQGYFNRTVLFYGQYHNGTIDGYNLPLSYLMVTGVVYGMFVVMLVYRMGQAYSEGYVPFGRRNDFSNKLFSAWDYHITSRKVAEFKRKIMRRHFEEEVWYITEREKKRTIREWATIVIVRIITNSFVLLCLAGASTAIYYTIRLSLDRTTSGLLTIETLVTSIVVSFINLFFPWLFSFLAELERYKTTPGKIYAILIRSVIVRLLPIVVLIGSLLGVISCTQPGESDGCSFNEFRVSARSQSENCPRCWETFIGQEVYRLSLVNLLTVNGAVIVLETSLHLLSKVNWDRLKWTHRFLHKDNDGHLWLVRKPEFEIPLSILDIWYTQALLWLGFFYCPYLPLITIATLVIHFYVRRYSLKFNCEPDAKPFHTARKNFSFLFLLLVLLFIILIPIGYSITRLQPSAECGPFRGQPYMYSVVNDTISDFNCDAQKAISFFGTAGFIVPLILALLLLSYSLYVVLRTRNESISLLKKQLVLDEADNVHLRGRQQQQ